MILSAALNDSRNIITLQT